MASQNPDALSSFGRLAVALDADFSELERLSKQLDRLDLESDGDLERAVKLLTEFAARSNAITQAIPAFSKALQEAQARSEAAAQLVSGRAQLIQERKVQQHHIHEKLVQVKQDVKAVNDSLAGFRKKDQSEFSDDEKRRIESEFERVSDHLTRFIAGTQLIKEEAGRSKFKSLEREAKDLLDTLEASRRRITKALTGK